MPLFGKKKKVDVDEIIQELTSSRRVSTIDRSDLNYEVEVIENTQPKTQTLTRVERVSEGDVLKLKELKVTVNVEGLNELINEIRELKNIINDLIEVLERLVQEIEKEQKQS